TRVELLVREPGTSTDTLLRSDIPINGVTLQQWLPEQPGTHLVTIRAYDANNSILSSVVRTIEVIPDTAISLNPAVITTDLAGASGAAQPTVIPLTPIPISGNAAFAAPAGGVIQVVATSTPAPTATPIPRYPPPPPIPGVPPGPVQSPLLNLSPPVCDAADLLGPFASDTSRRVVITEPDDVAARVVGGTTVFRAWRLQNVGTCTWGPGYELAFYGGRPMGSGGVAFESTFPGEPARRNAMTDPNRLIVPEGKPNQVAIVEVQLMTPVTPGIHQSYWRMRNPHGVFFGPIMGVTMEVVRDCAFGIYGAPVINRFEILGVGNVYHPTDPVNVQVDLCQGQNVVTLDYDIINANNFDIVFEDPTGNTQTVSTSDPSGRYSFPVRVLGEHTITLYADNGSCTVQAQVTVDARPCPGEDFALDIILGSGASAAANLDHVEISSSIPPDQIIAEWEYPHENVARFILEILKPNGEAQCTSPTTQCDDQAWWNWPLLKDVCEALFCTPSRGTVITRIEAGDSQTASIQMNTSIENLCAQAYTDPTGQSIVFQMLATDAQGFAASPALSNLVVIPCPVRLLPNEITTTSPATEIQTPIPMPTVIQNP
ncbi:MAG TPA: NBR1-Ig-like domain-containing protein, partial [Anaerolineae bacterium]|nr:NBR1-Ig-like domain-containing protein [Anaerolineae bacterium]